MQTRVRQALRGLQNSLAASTPAALFDSTTRNDIEGWVRLALLDMRFRLARGQVYAARALARAIDAAAQADMDVEVWSAVEIQQLINAIDSAQANRHALATLQLRDLVDSPSVTVRWASLAWLARTLAVEEGHPSEAAKLLNQALQLATGLSDEIAWITRCFAAEMEARGNPRSALRRSRSRPSRDLQRPASPGECLSPC